MRNGNGITGMQLLGALLGLLAVIATAGTAAILNHPVPKHEHDPPAHQHPNLIDERDWESLRSTLEDIKQDVRALRSHHEKRGDSLPPSAIGAIGG